MSNKELKALRTEIELELSRRWEYDKKTSSPQ